MLIFKSIVIIGVESVGRCKSLPSLPGPLLRSVVSFPRQVTVCHNQSVASRQLSEYISFGKIVVVLFHLAEISMGTYYGAGVGEIEFRAEHEKRQGVGQASDEEHLASSPAGEILVKQQQIVSEIQICLLRISLI